MADAQLATYQTIETLTADPARLVVMLFDGATRRLRQAQGALERGDIGRFAEGVARAHAIIAELSTALDREAGGPVAENLSRLYAFMLRHLTEGLARKSPAHLADVLRPLQELRQGFLEAVETSRHGGSPA